MIAIIDYGVGNLRSITKAVEILGGDPVITTDKKTVLKSDGIILPGVGAFKPAMAMLNKNGLGDIIKLMAENSKPLLGICLGMQLFFTESKEGGKTKGLNLIEGTVEKLPDRVKLPQMGWNTVKFQISNFKFQILKNIKSSSFFYFVHSYYCKTKDKKTIIATTDYGKVFPSVVQKGNIFGTQFHPEKSSTQGLQLLRNFVKICN